MGAEKMVERTCDYCGKPIMVRARTLRNNAKRGLNWGRFHKQCANIVRVLGGKNPNYKGGRSYHSVRVTSDRRLKIKERDNYRCRQCGKAGKELDPVNGVALDVHHDVPVREGGPDTDDNLVCLDRKCHNRIEHGREVKKYVTPYMIQLSQPQGPVNLSPPPSDVPSK